MLPDHDLVVRHRNNEATQDLVIPFKLLCNTNDEMLLANIKANSLPERDWLAIQPENELTAILCGSGASLADNLEAIKQLQQGGAVVFAMNGASKFLNDNGIMPYYQVIVDARPQTATLVDQKAWKHLFASQVDPKCFELVPDAIVWHQEIGEITEHLPEYHKDYALVGGGTSVGISAMCIAYTLGFRKIKCFGYDSSHKDNESHAFRQAMNDTEPLTTIRSNGKTYLCSFTMKQQAHKFQETAKALIAAGCEIDVIGEGLLPSIWNGPKMSEQEKYQQMWQIDGYRQVSPGEEVAELFVKVVKPEPNARIGDFGCGTGRGGLAISKLIDCDMTMIDFTTNSRDPEAQGFRFIQADLTQPIPAMVRHGYCCDVMEHIAPQDVDVVIENILSACKDCFFQISTIPDSMGAEIGQQLHLTVEPHAWWKEKLANYGEILWEEERDIASLFHVRSK